MRRNPSRPGAGHGANNRLASLPQSTHHHIAAPSQIPCKRSVARRRRRLTSASAFAVTAAILVSSVLVSSPAMIAPVGASYIPTDSTTTSSASLHQYSFAAGQEAKQPSLTYSGIASGSRSATSNNDSHLPYSAQPASSHSATSPSRDRSSSSSTNDVDDHLPQHLDEPTLHRQYARQYDDESALFGERDVSMETHQLQLDTDPSAAYSHATSSAHRYSLPSTYPSSIASSWSRPERSVWFQQKAIIITSIFLAIFIVLFIGAAVFLRERKFDDELAGLDDEEALARIEERMTMGRFSDPSEKETESPGAKIKRRLRLGRKRSEKDGSDSPDPSTGSSSAVKRKRHLVSRWTRTNLRDSNDTTRGTSDTASIRSGRSTRRAALGDPRAQESVEITYDSEGAEIPRTHIETGDTMQRDGSAGSAADSTTVNDDNVGTNRRPRSPPPPHPDSAERHPDTSSSEGRSSSNPDTHRNSTVDPDSSLRSPRRVLLDDSDFQAADAAEGHHDDMRHMPPAYLPSGSGGISGSSYDGAALAAAISRGDAKHGIPPPEERDSSVSPEVIGAVLAAVPAASRNTYDEPSGPTAAHIATDDKALLGALSAAASMPSAPAVDRDTSAPAYGAPEDSAAGGSSSSGIQTTAAASGPSAPALELDGEGFEVAPADNETAASGSTPRRSMDKDDKRTSKGKGKQTQTPSLLPAPPTAVETAFSPFDQPYRATSPPGSTVPPSTPGRVSPTTAMTPRKSEKQKEAEEEQLAHLVASRPETTDVPRYEKNGPSAPPLAEPEGGPESLRSIEHLPAYEQRRRSSAAAAAAQLGLTTAPTASAPQASSAPVAPSAPSAPPMHDEAES
ncbi:uncharacterized protein UTRI_06175 [Ustilago trichophora]|uniref:Uncharacterized protein n=1 Tax=Ustilago trichophora TaxID=86804 RepID=A0A5C3EHY1_9BASI|nr:uncharacterized protein UTRI_06175 [Ustilago trichophora]